MAVPLGLTIKHVDERGEAVYIAAHLVHHVKPTDGTSDYVAFNAGDDGMREMRGGVVFIMNATGKTIDVIYLDSAMPKVDAPAAA